MGHKIKHKVQFGQSLTDDLKEGTWTFEVPDLTLQAGNFALVPSDVYFEILTLLRRFKVMQESHVPDMRLQTDDVLKQLIEVEQ